ncbi:MAG: diaminopimelate epimerase [Alphaproteobacteria bacterium]|nr:MAG: diaminopimelate epimerase [Alphaproteobacteria bacterium]
MFFFRKMTASGNDFIVVDERVAEHKWSKESAQRLCDRHNGVGADQLLIIRQSSKADAKMIVYNADGSTALQCGNGLRAVTKYILNGNNFGLTQLYIQTGHDSIHKCQKLSGDVFMAQLGWPALYNTVFSNPCPEKLKNPLHVSTGNHHLVLWTENVTELDIDRIGQEVQKQYPMGINVHFVHRINECEICIRHWELGVGITQSCGSGSVAAVFAGHQRGFLEDEILVRTAVEEMYVEKRSDGYYLTGRVATVYDGCMKCQP